MLLVKAALSGVLLLGGELLKLRLGYPPALDQMAMYAFLALVGSAALGLYLRSVRAGALLLPQSAQRAQRLTT